MGMNVWNKDETQPGCRKVESIWPVSPTSTYEEQFGFCMSKNLHTP